MIAIPEFEFDIIAERDLEYREEGDNVTRGAKVRLGQPVFIPPDGESAGCWFAPYEIAVEGKDVYASHAFGEDAIQALQLVYLIIGPQLQSRFPGTFQWLGTRELGFPTPDENEASEDIPDESKS